MPRTEAVLNSDTTESFEMADRRRRQLRIQRALQMAYATAVEENGSNMVASQKLDAEYASFFHNIKPLAQELTDAPVLKPRIGFAKD